MKIINLQQAKSLRWCWFDNEERRKQIERYAAEKPEWTALDILRLPANEVSDEDKLFVVLHPSLIDKPILHSLACDFAERALSLDRSPHPASVKAIEVKRRWIKDEATDEELSDASDAAWAAASDAAWAAASDAAWAAKNARKRNLGPAYFAAHNATRAWQVSYVIEVLEAEYEAD